MSSRATVLVDTPTLVLVQVDHAPADSFSRSVMPTAGRRWKKAIHRSAATRFTAYRFAVDGLGTGGLTPTDTCVSFAAYAPSHEAAAEAIAWHIECQRMVTPA